MQICIFFIYMYHVVTFVFRNIIIYLDENVRGVNDLWTSVNHIAIVVSDVGTSLSFYTDVVGMKQVMRPNFDRQVNYFIGGIFNITLYDYNCKFHILTCMGNFRFQAWSMADYEQCGSSFD